MRLRLLGAAAAAVLVVIVAAAPALADGVTIKSIDASKFPIVTISAQVAGPTPDLADFALRENGKILQQPRVVPVSQTSTKIGVAMVIDISGSMKENNKIGAAKSAAQEFVQRKLPDDQMAVVAFSDRAEVVQEFTNDAGVLSSAIQALEAKGETALWDGIEAGRELFASRPDLQPNLVVLSDGVDTKSVITADQARANAVESKATVFALGLRGPAFDGTALQLVTDATGGTYDETADPKTLGDRYEAIRRNLQNQYEITYTSAATGTIELSLAAGGLRTGASFESGTTVRPPPPAFQPEVVAGSPLASFLGGTLGKILVTTTGLAAAGLAAFALIGVGIRDRRHLPEILRAYDPEARRRAAESGAGDIALAETAIVQRAVAATGRALEQRGLLDKLGQKLAQADLPLRPAEAAFFYAAGVAVLTVLGLFLWGPIGGFLALIFSVLVPLAALELLAGRRRRAFAEQLPDMLGALASSLRAGYSLLQGLEAVVQQTRDPMAREMRRALIEARLGRPVEEALGDAATRLGSADLEWAVMAVAIQREVGGNLAELLQTVAATMVARVRLQREIRALTAEGRISAVVLGLLPIGVAIFMYIGNPDYIGVLFRQTTGQIMLVVSILVALVGFYWMKKTIEIEV